MTDPDPNGYLMVFQDGPMSQVGNVETVASLAVGASAQAGSMVVKRDLFGWPLPDRLCVLCHPGHTGNVAMWAEGEVTDLPTLITESPNVSTYQKLRESQLPDDSDSHLMRGAEYRLT